MRRKLLLFGVVPFLLLCSSLVVSVDAASMWSRIYGGEKPNGAYSLVEAADGGYAIAGTLLVRTDALGNVQWNRTCSGTAYALVAALDGGYVLAGTDSPYGGDFWLMKTDSNGVMEWNRTFGGVGTEYACSLVAASDGGYLIAGCTASFGSGGSDFWLVKTDAFGNMQWNRTYGGLGDDVACSLIATADGGYALAGVLGCTEDLWLLYGFFFGNDAWLVKTDALGNMEWNSTYGGPVDDWASSVVEAPDGGYVLAGTFNFTGAFGPGGGDFWLAKTDALGNMEWSRTYGGEGEDLARSLVATSGGGYALAGTWYFAGPGFGSADYWLVKTDSAGNMEWNKTYGESFSDDYLYSLVAASDGGYAIAGIGNYLYSWDFSGGGYVWGNFWVVKTDELGVVPEFSSLLVPALVLTATAFIIINKKRLTRTR